MVKSEMGQLHHASILRAPHQSLSFIFEAISGDRCSGSKIFREFQIQTQQMVQKAGFARAKTSPHRNHALLKQTRVARYQLQSLPSS